MTSARLGGGFQEEADTCGHEGGGGTTGVKQEWTFTFISKFKYLIARSL